jgi:hypothetical protein
MQSSTSAQLIATTFSWHCSILVENINVSYKIVNRYNNEFPGELSPSILKALYDQGLTDAILVNYNPKACEGAFCYETSPNQNNPLFMGTPHATLMPGTLTLRTKPIVETIKSLGGLQV